MQGELVVCGAVCSWLLEGRRLLGVAEEEAEKQAGGRPGLFSERGEYAEGEASCVEGARDC